jgi:hypothetical protein
MTCRSHLGIDSLNTTERIQGRAENNPAYQTLTVTLLIAGTEKLNEVECAEG